MLARWLQRQWFQRRLSPALWLLSPVLWPLAQLFLFISARRRRSTASVRLPVPVIVVGNITVGGAGKTPLTLWLARALRERGWRPGIVSRGYGGAAQSPMAVLPGSLPAQTGDEPILLARRSGVPVWVGRDRVAAGMALLAAQPEVNVLLCDDGLQHVRLARDVALAVFDQRGIGNGQALPLGPLRELPERLAAVDALIGNDFDTRALWPAKPGFAMRLRPADFYRIDDPARRCSADDLWGRTLHAVAGIGNPDRFFHTLTGLGLAFVAHPFPDHHAYSPADLDFGPGAVLLMTEKDAVKCAPLLTGRPAREAWVLPVDAELPSALIDLILEKLRGRQTA